MPRLPGFVGPSYTSQSVVAADDQCINWIPAKIESGTGAAPWAYDPAPGFAVAVTGGDGPGRASLSLNQICYAVMGDYLVDVVPFPVGSITNLVNVGGSATGPASIAANGVGGNQVMVASGGELWWYNTGTLASGQIMSLGVTIDQVVFLDGYFIALSVQTNSIYLSALNDATSWDPADVSQRSDYPDRWLRMIVRSTELFLFGQQNTSVYYNDGTSDFPFVPNRNIAIQRGILSRYSLALLQGNPIWIADDSTVRYMNGYTPRRVSDHALEYAISQYSEIDVADGCSYNEQGHSIYLANFPNADELGKSWGFDLASGQWHQRGPYDEESDTFGVLPVAWAVYHDNLSETSQFNQLAFGRDDGTVYFMSQTYPTEIDGTTGITRRRRAPVLVDELKRIVHHNFTLFMEVGTANASPPGNDPTMLLQFSDDGGHTFNAGESQSIGTVGAWNTLPRWWMLGQARQRVYQLTCSAPIQLRLVDAFINHSIGTP